MTATTSAKIYLSDKRGKHELPWFRSQHMFNFGQYFDVHRDPPGDLYVFNEETLAGKHSFALTTEECTCVVIIPIVGAITCNDEMAIPGEALVIHAAARERLFFANPYEEEDELVNFIQLWFRSANNPLPANAYPFDIEQQGKLTALWHRHDLPNMHIGKFTGRTKGSYQKKEAGNDIFVFVIEGAFEVEDRLLHAKDALELSHFETIEFEALSNDAILLIIEIPHHQ